MARPSLVFLDLRGWQRERGLHPGIMQEPDTNIGKLNEIFFHVSPQKLRGGHKFKKLLLCK